MVPQLLLANSAHSINLVTQDQERNLGKFLNGEKGVEFGLGLGESFEVGGVDQEDDTIDFGEVISPKTTSYGLVRHYV